MSSSVWLVTGTTSGIGAALVAHLISRGEKVIASGRNVEQKLGHLKSENVALLELDLNSGRAEFEAQVKKAWGIFGHIDILMNNAGMSAMRAFEDTSDAFVNNMFQVNLFSHLHITQAILPLFRAQGHGTVAFTSSGSGWMALPFMSTYGMSKAALSTFAESLHKEISPLGLRSVAFDIGAFPTRLSSPREEDRDGTGSLRPTSDDYKPLWGELMGLFTVDPMSMMPGSPEKAASTMFDVIKREGVAAGKSWATRVVLGSDCLEFATRRREQETKLLGTWKDVSTSTDGREYKSLPGFVKLQDVAGLQE